MDGGASLAVIGQDRPWIAINITRADH